MAARVKRPGKGFLGEQRELFLCENEAGEELPFERLLGDAMAGDGALFASQVAVEAAWAIVDGELIDSARCCRTRAARGAQAADALIAGDGGWHALSASEVCRS